MRTVDLPSHSAILCLTERHSSFGEFHSNYLLNALAFWCSAQVLWHPFVRPAHPFFSGLYLGAPHPSAPVTCVPPPAGPVATGHC